MSGAALVTDIGVVIPTPIGLVTVAATVLSWRRAVSVALTGPPGSANRPANRLTVVGVLVTLAVVPGWGSSQSNESSSSSGKQWSGPMSAAIVPECVGTPTARR